MIYLEEISLRKINLNDYIKKIFINKDYSFNYAFTSKSVGDTNLLACAFAKYLRPKDIIDKIFHFDVYRIEDSVDFEDSIGTEYFSNGICIIEWGNIIKEILPKNTVFIDIKKDETDDNTRHFNIWRNV